MTQSYGTAHRWLVQQLAQSTEYQRYAEQYADWLLHAATGVSHSQRMLHTETLISPKALQWLSDALHRICVHHEPIQYIIGSVPFLELSIIVEPPILIPRPETEEWVSTVVASYHATAAYPRTILDLCTGSGCIGLALAHAFPTAQVIATDSNPVALNLAQRNAQANGIHNITFYQGDLYHAVPQGVTFDLITANPPYIDPAVWHSLDPSVRLWEDPAALIAAEQGYALSDQIIKESTSHAQKAQLWIECDTQQADTIAQLFAQQGFCDIQIFVDSYGKNRVVRGNYQRHAPDSPHTP